MSTKTKLIIGLLFIVQIGIFAWSYWEDLQEEAEFRALFDVYLQKPESVYSMNLSGWEIDRLLDDMEQFKNLEYLNLSNNNFGKIPNEVFDLPNLKYLDLSYNKIKNSISIENISNVNLSHNEIKEVYNIQNIDSLNVSNNQIKNITLIDIVDTLKHLNISNNELSESYNLSKLKHNCFSIDVSNNTFISLGESMFESNIILKGQFPIALIDSTSIVKSLIMRNCNLEYLGFISKPNHQLEYLDISQNIFKTINHFKMCENLKYLSLEECGFVTPNGILEVYNDSLKILNIDKIKGIGGSFILHLPNLETMYLHNSDLIKENIESLYLPKLREIHYNFRRPKGFKMLKELFPNTIIYSPNN